MKEATGELSITVITVVAIAAISTLFIVFLYPQLKRSIILNQACSNGKGYTDENVDCTDKAKVKNKGSKVCNVDDPAGKATWTCYAQK